MDRSLRRELEEEVDAIVAGLRRIRENSGKTLWEVAHDAGLGIGALSEIERGIRWRGRLLQMLALARALGCQPSDLLSPANRRNR